MAAAAAAAEVALTLRAMRRDYVIAMRVGVQVGNLQRGGVVVDTAMSAPSIASIYAEIAVTFFPQCPISAAQKPQMR